MQESYLVAKAGNTLGEMSVTTILRMLQLGELKRSDHGWANEEWVQLGTLLAGQLPPEQPDFDQPEAEPASPAPAAAMPSPPPLPATKKTVRLTPVEQEPAPVPGAGATPVTLPEKSSKAPFALGAMIKNQAPAPVQATPPPLPGSQQTVRPSAQPPPLPAVRQKQTTATPPPLPATRSRAPAATSGEAFPSLGAFSSSAPALQQRPKPAFVSPAASPQPAAPGPLRLWWGGLPAVGQFGGAMGCFLLVAGTFWICQNQFQNSSQRKAAQLRVQSNSERVGDKEPRPHTAEGLAHLKEAAALGDAYAQTDLADLLREGAELPQDLALAFELYRRAAAAGNADAQAVYGECLSLGVGYPQDRNAGREWLEKAAKGAPLNHDPHFLLALWHWDAEGQQTVPGTELKNQLDLANINDDNVRAFHAFFDAFSQNPEKQKVGMAVLEATADTGALHARFFLAYCLRLKNYSESTTDDSSATQLLNVAAEEGNIRAMLKLVTLHENQQDSAESRKWIRAAAEQGHLLSIWQVRR